MTHQGKSLHLQRYTRVLPPPVPNTSALSSILQSQPLSGVAPPHAMGGAQPLPNEIPQTIQRQAAQMLGGF